MELLLPIYCGSIPLLLKPPGPFLFDVNSCCCAYRVRSNMPSSTLLLLTSVVKLPLISAEAELAAAVLHITVLPIEGGMVTGGYSCL